MNPDEFDGGGILTGDEIQCDSRNLAEIRYERAGGGQIFGAPADEDAEDCEGKRASLAS